MSVFPRTGLPPEFVGDRWVAVKELVAISAYGHAVRLVSDRATPGAHFDLVDFGTAAPAFVTRYALFQNGACFTPRAFLKHPGDKRHSYLAIHLSRLLAPVWKWFA